MGRKGGKKHLKRKPAPKFWPIHRKEFIWTVKPHAGPHSILGCIPLIILIREMLGFAKTQKEAKSIISSGKIKVDGKIQRAEKFPVGLMDIVSIPEIEKTYRVIPSKKGLTLNQIEKGETDFKLCRIENKTAIPGGQTQLNLHDGRNILIGVNDPKTPQEDVYHTLDTLKINLPSQEVTEHMTLSEGALAIIVGGKNVGRYGKIVSIEEKEDKKRRNSLVTIDAGEGENIQTILNLVFVVGYEQPTISIPEVS